MNVLALYLLVLNILTFVLMGIDKKAAIVGAERISEFAFFVMGVIGGGLGICFGMGTFGHKTKKPLFNRIIPVITVVETAVVLILFLKLI